MTLLGGGEEIVIRLARQAEADALTRLAHRSKAHWGYDEEFLRDCREELTISPAYVQDNAVFVAVTRGALAGLATLKQTGGVGVVSLDHLYVEPSFIGQGIGKRLFNCAVEEAARQGFSRVLIESDPHAESFYLSMGAKRIGESPSPVRAGRLLPLLEYTIS